MIRSGSDTAAAAHFIAALFAFVFSFILTLSTQSGWEWECDTMDSAIYTSLKLKVETSTQDGIRIIESSTSF